LQGSCIYFFQSQNFLKTACFEENIHHKVEQVEKGREKGGLESENLFDFFAFVVKNSSKTW
jgi:hypothetical protein